MNQLSAILIIVTCYSFGVIAIIKPKRFSEKYFRKRTLSTDNIIRSIGLLLIISGTITLFSNINIF